MVPPTEGASAEKETIHRAQRGRVLVVSAWRWRGAQADDGPFFFQLGGLLGVLLAGSRKKMPEHAAGAHNHYYISMAKTVGARAGPSSLPKVSRAVSRAVSASASTTVLAEVARCVCSPV